MQRATLFALALTTAGLAACGGGTPFISYSRGPEILAAFTGNSVVGQNAEGQRYCEFHYEDGGIFGRDFEFYRGSWRVTSDDFICYSYESTEEDCQRALVDGNRVTLKDATTGETLHSGSFVNGNVCR